MNMNKFHGDGAEREKKMTCVQFFSIHSLTKSKKLAKNANYLPEKCFM